MEQAMDKSGGLGKYNIVCFFIISAGFAFPHVYLYNLAVLTMMPDFICLNDEEECTNKVVCQYEDFSQNPYKYIDSDSRYTLQNWT